MESLPTLQNLHDALVSDSNVEAEEELLSVMTHLLVCAIEDPGVPNPGRHTTLLGQSLRNADITNSNVSEILRIYLYATATGEIRQMFGVVMDRERERRIPDHHQIDADSVTHSGKNAEYYKLLHENDTWKLSQSLKDRPFVALNPTRKAQILAHLCNDLLMNKAVLKQIDNSLETCAQMRKEKYMTDMKVRKYKALHMRKSRIEAYEKLQAEREAAMQAAAAAQQKLDAERLEKENVLTETANKGVMISAEIADGALPTDIGNSEQNNNSGLKDQESMQIDSDSPQKYSDKDKDLPNLPILEDGKLTSSLPAESACKQLVKLDELTTTSTSATSTYHHNGGPGAGDFNALLNTKKSSTSRPTNIPDDASTDVGMDEDISDIESEITNVEEDEDNKLSADELQKKLDKIIRASLNCKEVLEKSTNQLRATCFGQDRFWRRYWRLPKAGGIFIEALESAQNDIFHYHEILEKETEEYKMRDAKSQVTKGLDGPEGIKENINDDSRAFHTQEQSEEDVEMRTVPIIEKQQVDSLSKNVNDISGTVNNPVLLKGIPNNDGADDSDDDVVETNRVEPEIVDLRDDDDDDYDVAIQPQAIQLDNNGAAKVDKPDAAGLLPPPPKKEDFETDIKIPIMPSVAVPANIININNNPNNKLLNCDNNKLDKIIAINQASISMEDLKKEDDCIIVSTTPAPCMSTTAIELKPPITTFQDFSEKWFSIVNREVPLTTTEPQSDATMADFQRSYANITCSSNCQIQGHPWDLANNVQYFTVTMEDCKADFSKLSSECVLSLSGLDEQEVEKKLRDFEIKLQASKNGLESPRQHRLKSETETDMECDDEEHLFSESVMLKNEHPEDKKFFPFLNDALMDSGGGGMGVSDLKAKSEIKLDEALCVSLQNMAQMSLANISNFIQYDVQTPLNMTMEENRQLERIKREGFPNKLSGNFVPYKLRYGWWKVDTMELLQHVIDSLNPTGLRERELRENLTRFLSQEIPLGLAYSIGEAKAEAKEFILPDKSYDWSPKIAKRVEMALLEQLEALEDKIASASMQLKNWQLPPRIESELNLESDADITEEDFVSIIPMIRERIIDLEANIERRYLKPPLGAQTGDVHLAAIAQNQQNSQTQNSAAAAAYYQQMQQQQQQQQQQQAAAAAAANHQQQQQLQSLTQNQNAFNPSAFNERAMALAAAAASAAVDPAGASSNNNNTSNTENNSNGNSPASNCDSDKDEKVENIPKGLMSWRDAVSRSHTTAQLAMALYVLESCVAWDKSIMKAVSWSIYLFPSHTVSF